MKGLNFVAGGVAVAVIAAAGVMNAAGAGVKAAPAPRAVAPAHVNPAGRLSSMNPHLHGATKVTATPVKKAVKPLVVGHETQLHPGVLHMPWRNRWDLVAWRAAHLRYGEVRGVVDDAAGAPVKNAHVWLQHPNGRPFARRVLKHIQDTNARGEFVMRHVLAGEYKLNTFGRGVDAKTSDREPLAVHQGNVDMVRLTLKKV